MAKDYYKILGVDKNASGEEIKRAYRKLAHQYHPDVAKEQDAGLRFKEINEAYQVLSDPQKRAQYDQFGQVGDQPGFSGFSSGGRGFDFSGFGFGGGSFGDIFEDLFGGVFSQVQSEVEISLTAALLGQRIEIQTNQGEKISLDIPAGTQDGSTFRLRGKGLPTKRGRGDLILTIRIRMPRRLSREQKELLERLRQTGL